jgi:putative GTP pyrophosphokinase
LRRPGELDFSIMAEVATGSRDDEGPTPEDWGAEYRRDLGSWEDFTARVERLVRDLLDREGLEVVQIESRTKEVESFVGKLKRKNSKYAEPLREVTDLAGVRVITYYLEDVERVVDCLKHGFDVVAEHSRGSISAIDPDRFGYRSDQYVMRVSKERRQLPEWQQFGAHSVEVQVRTALQHAWSAIDHKLNYKTAREVPRHLKRRLSRLSALLELGDEQFSSLRDATNDLDAEYSREIEKGRLDLDVDLASLDAYLTVTGIGDRWVAAALEAGYVPAADNPKQLAKDRSDLLLVLQRLGVKTIKKLDDILQQAERDWGATVLARVNTRSQELGFSPPLTVNAYEAVTQLVLVGRRADPKTTAVYHDAIAAAMNEIIARDAEG